ncbi:host cell division inhibitory peptide Kil [Cronobacter muytjensii]|uniref:host cell division inhibitory peptide Kil n=1 Tax=Cronobacter muytjensii TaxID=413501 RepID=UPI002DB935A8|nr:host cell division inhibitory peptide Kil [Cronobacter muytjensii]MEB8638618.1 host cell division inhibitory peptide Kil [Cronobacter muytjensii]
MHSNTNAQQLRNKLAAIRSKAVIAKFVGDEKMLEDAQLSFARTISEVCLNDPIIRARFSALLQ